VSKASSTYLDRLTAERTNGIGLSVSGCARLEYGSVTLRDTARTHLTHRAISVENTTYVIGDRVWVYDTQATATGYIIGSYGVQQGTLGRIIDQIPTHVVIDNRSGLSYTLV
jgi:hypothetical protein